MVNPLKINFDSRRVYGLDMLRAIAIISVVFAHGGKLMPVWLSNFQNYYLVDGVFLFFVLSGFLIGGILIKILETNKATIRTLFNFWIRRWFRTIPNYFLILTVLIILSSLLYGGLRGTDVLRYYFFFQNFNFAHPGFFSEAWTLSVEEWFYLLIPASTFILVGVFRLKPKRAILLVAVSIIIASIGFRSYRYAAFPVQSITDWDSHIRKEVVTRLDSIMFGVLGAYFAYYYKALWVKHKKALFWIGLGIIASQQAIAVYINATRITETGFGWYITVPYFTIMAIGILLLLPLLSELKTGKGKVYVSLTYISIISYSMYLIHVSLVQSFAYWVTRNGTSHIDMLIRYALYWSVTIVGAILIYNFFEKPTTNLREKLVHKRYHRAKESVLDAEAGNTVG